MNQGLQKVLTVWLVIKIADQAGIFYTGASII